MPYIGARVTSTHQILIGDGFSDTGDVAPYSVMIASKHFSGATHAALNFIDDQKDAVLVADAPQSFQESFRRWHITAFALHCFDDDRGDFFRRRSGFEKTVLDPVQSTLTRAAVPAVLRAERVAIFVGVRYVDHVEHLPLESDALCDAGRS